MPGEQTSDPGDGSNAGLLQSDVIPVSVFMTGWAVLTTGALYQDGIIAVTGVFMCIIAATAYWEKNIKNVDNGGAGN